MSILDGRKDTVIEAIQRVHGTHNAELEDVLEVLEELRDYADELASGVREDIRRRDAQ